jgi:hypothetical protein
LKRRSLLRGTEGSNPTPSSGESGANLAFRANLIDDRRGFHQRQRRFRDPLHRVVKNAVRAVDRSTAAVSAPTQVLEPARIGRAFERLRRWSNFRLGLRQSRRRRGAASADLRAMHRCAAEESDAGAHVYAPLDASALDDSVTDRGMGSPKKSNASSTRTRR